MSSWLHSFLNESLWDDEPKQSQNVQKYSNVLFLIVWLSLYIYPRDWYVKRQAHQNYEFVLIGPFCHLRYGNICLFVKNYFIFQKIAKIQFLKANSYPTRPGVSSCPPGCKISPCNSIISIAPNFATFDEITLLEYIKCT